MAAPNNTSWSGDFSSSGKGRIGISLTTEDNGNTVTATAQVWFWTRYTCVDSSNTFYDGWTSDLNALQSLGSRSINNSDDKYNKGTGWHEGCQVHIHTASKTFTKGSSASTAYFSAKYTGVEYGGGSGNHSVSFTIPAKPAPSSYTVSYHSNGGYGSMEDSIATLGSDFKTSKNTFTKPGHAFNGWKHTAPNGEEITWHLNGSGMYESGIPWTWTYEYDVKLYAQWIPAKDVYDITFDGNGGEVKLIDDFNFTPTLKCSKNKNSAFPLSNILPIRSGYTFKYWLAKQSDTPILIKYGYYQEYNDKDNNTEPIKSVWMKRISSDGTSHGTDGWEILVNATNCSIIKAPTWTTYNGQNDDLIWHELGSGNWERNGHNFNFSTWIETRNHKDELIDYITHLYAYDSYGNQLGAAYSVGTGSYSVEFYPENSYSYNQDVTLYAHWEANIYDITINLENGNINGDSSPIVLEEAITFDETSFYSNLADYIPVKPSYEFDGFYDSEGIKVYDKEGNTVESKYWNNDGQYIHAGDLVLYAHWKPLNLAYYNTNGEWVLCNSYVKDNGVWKPAVMNLKTEQGWEKSMSGELSQMKPILVNGVYISNFVKLEYYFDGVESNYADYYLTFSTEPTPVKTKYEELVFETGDNWYIPETNSWNTSLVRTSIENDEIAPLVDTVDYSLNAQKIYNDRTKLSIECSIGTINTNTFYHYSANAEIYDQLGRILENYCLNNTYCMIGTLDMNYE